MIELRRLSERSSAPDLILGKGKLVSGHMVETIQSQLRVSPLGGIHAS